MLFVVFTNFYFTRLAAVQIEVGSYLRERTGEADGRKEDEEGKGT